MPKIDKEMEQFQNDLLNSIGEMKRGVFAAVHTPAQIEARVRGASMQVRKAFSDDIPAIRECDVYAASSRDRAQFIATSVEQQRCFVATDDGRIVGYVVLTHDFFDHGFVALVAVSPAHRRKGVGLWLFSAAEAACKTRKLFTSTNHSNLASQQLILKAGFQRSGIVENLDDGDPELLYVKFLH